MKRLFCDRCGIEIDEALEESKRIIKGLFDCRFKKEPRKCEKVSIVLFFDKKPFAQDVALCEECREKFIEWLNEGVES